MTKTIFGTDAVDDRFFNGTEDRFPSFIGYQKDDFSFFSGDPDVKYVTRGGDDAVLLYGAPGRKTVDAGAGEDFVRAENQTGVVVRLGSGNDSYRGDGDIAAKVNGGSGNDTFFGDGANGSYFGEGGDDDFTANHYFLDYQAGNTFHGGLGKDHFSYLTIPETNSRVYINLDKGVAWAHSPALKDRLVGIDNATGSTAHDTLIGSNFGNTLSGGEGDDIIRGLAGNDILYGEGLDIDILGGGSADRLIGGTGNDRLVGGMDADVLEGGIGRDIFVYAAIEDSTVKERDTIKDFRSAQHDRIDLSAIDADITMRGDQDFSFIGRAAFTGEAGEVNVRFGVLSADVDGDAVADFQVRLFGIVSLAKGDLIL